MVKATIFDIDGTLLDSVDLHARAWQEALSKFGHDVAFEQVRHQIGKGGDQFLPVFLTKREREQFGEELEEYRGRLFKRKYLPLVKPFPRVRELFQHLRRDGKRIVLASSAKADEIETYKKIAKITDLVEDEASSDDAERSKPHPDIFEAALKRLPGVKTGEVVVIGDTPYDAQAATKANLECIGVRCGGFSERELLAAGCSVLYDDCADLLENYNHSPLAGGKAA